jgi:hypothetical protein
MRRFPRYLMGYRLAPTMAAEPEVFETIVHGGLLSSFLTTVLSCLELHLLCSLSGFSGFYLIPKFLA